MILTSIDLGAKSFNSVIVNKAHQQMPIIRVFNPRQIQDQSENWMAYGAEC
jgi:hypothetical protein